MSQSFNNPIAPGASSSDQLPRLLRVAWMGIALGLFIEVLLLAVMGIAGKMPPLVTIVADTAQKVTWSTLVCAALAAAQTLWKMRTLGMAAAGLLGAPIALLLARSVHKAVNTALGAEPVAQSAVPWLLVSIKGIEYALLGVLLIWLAKHSRGLKAYVATGAGVGLVFVCLLSWLMPVDGLQPTLMRAINEVVHPLGCALVIYFGSQFGVRLGEKYNSASLD